MRQVSNFSNGAFGIALLTFCFPECLYSIAILQLLLSVTVMSSNYCPRQFSFVTAVLGISVIRGFASLVGWNVIQHRSGANTMLNHDDSHAMGLQSEKEQLDSKRAFNEGRCSVTGPQSHRIVAHAG